MARSRWWALVLAGCQTASDGGAPELPASGLGDTERAEALLAPEAVLPSRAEVVGLTDRLTIAAADLEDDKERARLTLLAAQLRERIWRLDASSTDAREALELYGQVATAKAGEDACHADLRRARLAAELSHDAAEAYRAIYLALERHGDDEAEDCTRKLRAMLVRAEAYRPSGDAWQALQQEAARQSPEHEAPDDAGAPLPSPTEGAEEVVVVPPAERVKGGARLTGISPYSYPKGGRVVLELDAPARYETGMLAPDPKADRGHRVYLDLIGVRTKGVKKDIDADGLVDRIRVGKRKNGTRVVLDLADAARRRIFYLPDPFRVVIDVSAKEDAPPEKKGDDRRGRVVRRIALDPGHGGWDAGAVGPTGLREKDVALDIAHRAAPALASELAVETMLTRDKDVYVELEERTARANAFQSDLFVSIHCNATENGQATGYEVFILDPSREQDRTALRAVARENHRRQGGAMDPSELDAQLTDIARGLTFATTTERSRRFADLLRTATQASLGLRYPQTHDHGVKHAGFFVLVGAQMPAVLYETSFISNPADEAKLSTADYRQKLADAIVNAVRAYMEGH